MMRIVTFKIDESLLEKLDKLCLKHNMARSEVIRRAIELFIDISETNSLDEVRKIIERKRALGYIEKIPIL